MVGLKYNKDLPVDSQMKTFYISIKCLVAFHVNFATIPPPSKFNYLKTRKYHRKLLNLFNMANNNINSTSKLKRKLD